MNMFTIILKQRLLSTISAAVALLLLLTAVQADQDRSVADRSFTEGLTLLTRPPENTLIYIESAATNPDFTKGAYVAAGEEGMRIVANSEKGELYDSIAKGYPIMAPETDTVGYLAGRNGRHYAVIDGRKSPPYDGVCCLRFSPNGEHSAYIAHKDNRQFVVLNGRPLRQYEMIDQLTGVLFSPDSSQTAYIAVKNGRQTVVHNGREQPPFDNIDEIGFSPDSSELAYIAVKNDDYYIMRNERPTGPFDIAQALTWSPDGSHLAAVAIRRDRWLIIKNDEKIDAGVYTIRTFFDQKTKKYGYSAPQLSPPAFSPDSAKFAYVRMDKGKFRVVVNDKAGPALDQVETVFFSPDSKHFAYIGLKQDIGGNREFVVLNEEPGRAYDQVDSPLFSPDGRRLAYRARKGSQWCMVVDGNRQGGWYDRISPPYFSPDSSTLVYRARNKGKYFIVENGREHPPYDEIAALIFSPDSSQMAYRVQKGDAWLIVRNKKEGRHYRIVPPEHFKPVSDPVFSPGNHLIYFARSTGKLYESKIVVDEQEGNQLVLHSHSNPIIFLSETHWYTIVGQVENDDETASWYRLDVKITD